MNPTKPLALALAFAFATLALAGCSAVKASQIAPDYATRYRTQVKRIVVLTMPAPADDRDVAGMWSTIGKRYVNQKFDYIAKGTAYTLAAEGLARVKAICAAEDLAPVEGVLWFLPTELRKGNEVKATVSAKLLACPDASEVWSAQGEGTWPSKDDQLTQFTQDYVREIGPQVEPYVAPTFRLLKSVLDTLPNPTLTDSDKDDKIEVTAE